MKPGLYIVGTPIGNLDDLSPRAASALREVDGILTEDTRRTRILLDRHGIRTPMISCHKFNEASRLAGVLERVQQGAALALVSESGMPVVSDPGSRLVTACHRLGLPVTVIPGPSAVTAAVALAGFSGSGFIFQGFLPRKRGARARRLRELAAAAVPVVLFESPYRLLALIEDLGRVDPGRSIFVGRELTKKFEEYAVGKPAEILQGFKSRPVKGEVVVVMAPHIDTEEDDCYCELPAGT